MPDSSVSSADRAWCEHALAHAQRIGWQDGVDHYTERLLALDYAAWASGDVSEISDEAMCYGSATYREAHPELCG